MLIDSQEDLVTACSQAAATACCAVDVEFNRRNTYAPEVALVQIAGRGMPTALLDTVQLSDVTAITRFLESPHCTKIIHSCSQDLEAFSVICGTMPVNCIDTQIAAAFCGMGFQLGFSTFVQECLGKEIDKHQQTSDWIKRPLSPAQIEYAAADVDDLLSCYDVIREKLEKTGKLDWVKEECDDLIDGFMEKQFLQRVNPARLRGAGRLRRREYTCLGKLMVWREELSMRRNRPCQWMVPNNAMLEIATAMPKTMDAIHRLTNLTPKQKKFYGQDIVAQVMAADALPDNELLEPPDFGQLTPGQKRKVSRITKLVKYVAEEVDVAPQVVAGSKDIKQLVRTEDLENSLFVKGWRRDLMADELTKIV